MYLQPDIKKKKLLILFDTHKKLKSDQWKKKTPLGQ